MPYYKYRPLKQFPKQYTRIFKQIYLARKLRRQELVDVPESVRKLGVDIWEPANDAEFMSGGAAPKSRNVPNLAQSSAEKPAGSAANWRRSDTPPVFDRNWNLVPPATPQSRIKRQDEAFARLNMKGLRYPMARKVEAKCAPPPMVDVEKWRQLMLEKHPAFYVPTEEESNPLLWQNTPCLLHDGSDPLAEGIRQALVLSKAVPRDGLPASMMAWALGLSLPADHEQRISRMVLNSRSWDATLDPLPKRFNPELFWLTYPRLHGVPLIRRCNLLLDDMYHYCQLNAMRTARSWGSLSDVRFHTDDQISVMVPPYGKTSKSDYEEKKPSICYRFEPHLTLFRPRDLEAPEEKERKGTKGPLQQPMKSYFEPFENANETINEPLPDLHPISPTIDLRQNVHVYRPRSFYPRHNMGDKYGPFLRTAMMGRLPWWEGRQEYPLAPSEHTAAAILNCFALAVANAKRIYGENFSGTLNQPIVTHFVQLYDSTFDFIAFQLNTMDFTSIDGVKNIAFLDRGQLYQSEPFWELQTSVPNYSHQTFLKFLAVVMNS